MNEKVVVIIGANSGIGKETTVALAAMGSTTVLGSRLAPARGTRITTSPWPYAEAKLANILFTRGTGPTPRTGRGDGQCRDYGAGALRLRHGKEGAGLLGLGFRLGPPLRDHRPGGRRDRHLPSFDSLLAGRTGGYWPAPAAPVSRVARDDEAAERLWSESERLLGRPAFRPSVEAVGGKARPVAASSRSTDV
ncbi:MAG: hypothetical protein M3256_23300 [Actinomycetota bacterium]|nr:hypothetical protein [Actinomycetota bacterium]